MANDNNKSRRNRIIGGAILAAIIVLIILIVVPILGVQQTGMISTGATTHGGGFGIHLGAYQ